MVLPEILLRFCPSDNRGFARLRSRSGVADLAILCLWCLRLFRVVALSSLQSCRLATANTMRSGFADLEILRLRRLRHFRDEAMSSLQSCRLATANKDSTTLVFYHGPIHDLAHHRQFCRILMSSFCELMTGVWLGDSMG